MIPIHQALRMVAMYFPIIFLRIIKAGKEPPRDCLPLPISKMKMTNGRVTLSGMIPKEEISVREAITIWVVIR